MNEYKITDKMHSWQKTYPVWVSALSVIVLLIIWELICRAGIVSPLFLPSPTGILSALADMVAGGEIAVSLAASMYRIILGFVLGSVIGLAVGLFTGTSALIDRIGSPIVNALYPIPKIALLPLFILWLGIGELSKVTIIALGVFFPVAMNTYAGLRLAAGTSLLLLVAAEMIAAQEGIGALILHYGDLMITDRLMAGVIVLSLLGLVFNLLLQWAENRAIPWNR